MRDGVRKRAAASIDLYYELENRGYPEDFCDAISFELNTEYTAKRMLGYLRHYEVLPVEDIVDEMLAILSDRERFIQKKILEHDQAKWNEYMMYGFGFEEEE